MAGKYAPLEQYLRELPENQLEVRLGFEQLEKILASNLPASAFEDRRWWEHAKEGNHLNARAWAKAGWKVEQVNFAEQWVRLVRVGRGV
jgi:hypothetical protein